jgi:hypothetical protein
MAPISNSLVVKAFLSPLAIRPFAERRYAQASRSSSIPPNSRCTYKLDDAVAILMRSLMELLS